MEVAVVSKELCGDPKKCWARQWLSIPPFRDLAACQQ